MKARTLTMIVDTDRRVADIYVFDGFHSRLAWSKAETAYVGSYGY